MKYDLSTNIDKQRFQVRAEKLMTDGNYVELKRIFPTRTNQQRKYLHVILNYFGCEYGETLDYVKQIMFKQIVNRELFETEYTNPKTGEIRKAWRSTEDLDTGEKTLAIERFRDYSSKEAGIYLPEPNEHEFIRHCEITIERNKQYI